MYLWVLHLEIVFHSFVFKKPTVFLLDNVRKSIQEGREADRIKVQEGLASGTVIKRGLFVCSDPGFKEASPPTSPRAGCQAVCLWPCSPTSFLDAHFSPTPPPAPRSPPTWPHSPAQWRAHALPFWPTDSRMESISGFNPRCSLGCGLPGSVPPHLVWPSAVHQLAPWPSVPESGEGEDAEDESGGWRKDRGAITPHVLTSSKNTSHWRAQWGRQRVACAAKCTRL